MLVLDVVINIVVVLPMCMTFRISSLLAPYFSREKLIFGFQRSERNRTEQNRSEGDRKQDEKITSACLDSGYTLIPS